MNNYWGGWLETNGVVYPTMEGIRSRGGGIGKERNFGVNKQVTKSTHTNSEPYVISLMLICIFPPAMPYKIRSLWKWK